MAKFNNVCTKAYLKAQSVLKNEAGESYVDTGVKMLIAIVIGALLLTTLYTIMEDVVLANVSAKITAFFAQTPELA